MTKIIHASDLHLKESEKDYCFAVLDEMLAIAQAEAAGYLLFCGDLFDSFEDMKAMRVAFRQRVEKLKGCKVIYIPGNHEDLRRTKDESLETYDLGPITICLEKPYALISGDNVEFICIPHQESYAGYRDWGAPPKAAGKARVVLIHGTAPSIYCGPETEESKSGVIDGDMFETLGANYVAMGHIHSQASMRSGNVLASYSGSARVWRAGVEGPRGINLLQAAGGEIKPLGFRELRSAGQYRFFELPLTIEGGLEAGDIEPVVAATSKNDLVEISILGVVEDETLLGEAEAQIRAALSDRRALKISRGEIVVAAGLAGHPAARQFLEKWRARKPDDYSAKKAAWLLARAIGLKAIAGVLK